MRKIGLAILALFIMTVAAISQDLSKVQQPPVTVFDIPFAFHADKAVLPAGTYEIRPNFEGTMIELRNIKSPTITIVRAMTGLSPRPLPEAAVAFDVLGADHYLAEFYLPGVDGQAFNGAPGKHKHEVIVPKK